MSTRTARGFTLVELMIVIAVVSILANLAVPAMQSLMASQQVKTTASTLQFAMMRARSESLKRNSNITVAPAATGQWAAGWNVVNPADGSVLSTYNAVSNVTIAGPPSVVYRGSGRLNATAAPSFKISSASTIDIRCIAVDLSGMPQISTTGC